MERHLVMEQPSDLVRRRDARFAFPGRRDLLAQLERLERFERARDTLEVADGRHAAAHDRREGLARVIDRVLKRHERAVRVTEHRVAPKLQGEREHDHVLRHPLERPRARRGGLRSSLRPLVDQQQPNTVVADLIEVVGELVMVEPRPAVQDDQRDAVSRPSLDHPQRAIVDPDRGARAAHPRAIRPRRPAR